MDASLVARKKRGFVAAAGQTAPAPPMRPEGRGRPPDARHQTRRGVRAEGRGRPPDARRGAPWLPTPRALRLAATAALGSAGAAATDDLRPPPWAAGASGAPEKGAETEVFPIGLGARF